jgi:nucleoside-diphosphate-sugar epimerase
MNYSEKYWKGLARVVPHIPNLQSVYGKTFFITGATGMICSTVADLLFHLNDAYHANIKIILAGRSKERVEKRFYAFQNEKDYQYVKYDATVSSNLKLKADYIIHGASNANPGIYVRQPVETMLANLVGLNSLLDSLKENSTARLLYLSSSEVYGQKDNKAAYKEEDYGYLDILNQRASYPSSKRAAETLCVAYNQEYSIDTVIVRPGHIYGPSITESDNRASAQFTRCALAGENIVMKSAGTQLRSYCYTADCASAILAVLINGESGKAYNISNKESVVTISDLAHTLADIVGRRVIYENPTDNEKQGYNLMSNSSLEAEKLEKLGWKAVFNLYEGVKNTIDVMKG